MIFIRGWYSRSVMASVILGSVPFPPIKERKGKGKNMFKYI
jgi:hypothetical protein